MAVVKIKPAGFIHPSSEVASDLSLGADSQIWLWCQIRDGVKIGEGTSVGSRTLIESGVTIGNHVKIQSNVLIYSGVTIEDGVFVGPAVCFSNDKFPRAIFPNGQKRGPQDWKLVETRVCRGASLGAGSVIVCGVTIGRWAMVGAGSVVTKSVPDFALVYGNPARIRGYVCACGRKVARRRSARHCSHCSAFL